MMQSGKYHYVKYDRRNGSVLIGTAMYLRDPKTFEVALTGDLGQLIGFSIIATKWRWWEMFMWWLTGRAELDRWSPVRFFFVQAQGFIQHVA